MQTYESLKHTTWECKYHVVFHSFTPLLSKLAGEVGKEVAFYW